ncbi:MAG: hypothetical protein IKL10_06450 [Clostridia bacterium]|nr:hypothetical protein [Clostridia bacterium]
MGRLRRSRLAKFVAGFMILILAAAIVANIVGTALLMEENLYYASREQIQQKVYSYVYDYTASDLMRYLRSLENTHINNDNYKNYHQSELQLYKSKYSSENSNIYFNISDEKGNILLKNSNVVSEPYFTFSSLFSTETEYNNYYNDWFVMGGSEKADSVTIAPYITEESTVFENFFEEENVTEEQELYDDTITETTTHLIEDDNETSSEITSTEASDNTSYLLEEVTVYNKNSDNETIIYYYYHDGLNFKILEYCKGLVENLSYDITEITFYQDDFTVHYYGDSYGDYEIYETYNATDESLPERSFTTKLLSGSKEADITYTYNGSFYDEEFQNRLSFTSLIIGNSEDNDPLIFDYKQKGRIQLKVEIHVPYICYANDIYKAAESFVDIVMVYRDNIVLITIIDILLFIASFVFIFYSAGFIPKKEKPVARGLHAIYFDVYILITVLAAVGCFALIDTYDMLFNILGFIGLALLLLGFIYTFAVRLRTKSLKTGTLIYKVYKAVKNAAEVMDEASGSKLRIFLVTATFLLISACEIVCFMILETSSYAIGVILFFVRLIEIPFVILLLVALTALQSGAKAISKGDVSYRIRNSFLVGPLKKHADYLNSINDAVNCAVEERLKSESLKTELITNVSHDLKTPLTSIVNYVDLLKKEDIDNPKALQYIEVIDRQSQRLKKLTIDIVEASKAATGNIEVNCENTVLNVILLQTNGEYIERLEEKALTLVQEIPENDITISTDGRLLWRVIDNLMNNICKYSMPGTRVYLTLWENKGKAFISFRNISRNKLNISPENLTERFVRGDTSRNTEGSGLGLSIANSLTEILGGKLSIIIDGDLFKVTLSFPTIDVE